MHDSAAPEAARALLDGLNDEQVAAITEPNTPLAIIAGAGAGKTRVLTRRVAYQAEIGSIEPQHALVLTFTRKAAGELRERLRELGLRSPVAAGTFHAVAYSQLRQRWSDRGETAPDLLDRKVGFVGRLLPRNDNLSALDVVGEIEWAKARMVSPSTYVEATTKLRRRPPGSDAQRIAALFDEYEIKKRRARMVDFDDLLAICCRHMRKDTEWAAAQRWRYRHLFVDEFQDVNPLQHSLLQAWLGDTGDLCVVGDPDQAIYGWNGADASLLTDFGTGTTPGVTRTLVRNHRSTPQILAVATAVLDSDRELEAVAAPGPIPGVRSHEDDRAEARAVARAIRDGRAPGHRWSDQAVLARTNAQLTIVEETLGKLGIPCRTRGGAGLLAQPEVAAVLRGWARDERPLPLAIADLEENVREMRAGIGAADADLVDLEDSDQEATDGDRGAIAEQCVNLEALIRVANDHLALDRNAYADRFARWARATFDHEAGSHDAVDLTTFHAAKGLEWPIVHLIGFEDGLVPISYARTAAAQAEERRLAYVAMTRAERKLDIHWAHQRTFGSKVARRDPSPFIEPIVVACHELENRRKPGDGRRHLANMRKGLRRQAPPDDATLEALKEWRRKAARAADVPAYVVFHDTTLEELASTKPTERKELLDVPGIGRAKLDRYGDALLEILAD